MTRPATSPRATAPAQRTTSSALGLASVTAVLKHLLENGVAARGVTAALGGDATVSSLPPDRVPSGADERAQLNIFLYLVTPRVGLSATASRDGGDAAPLTLELRYLLSAYGSQDYNAEILLGHALQLLHERPSLGSADVAAALAALTDTQDGRVIPPALAALRASDLAQQVERVEIRPEFLSAEEISKLWSALQARYRPSAVYRVSAVMIRGERAASVARTH
ncbi:MAG: DUF4255 domain-containing protein [Gemmatirosa sp.]